MKKHAIYPILLMSVLLLLSNYAFSQGRANDAIIADIDSVLASAKIPAIKKAMATTFVTELEGSYVAKIDATADSAIFKTTEKAAVLGIINAYKVTIAAIAGPAVPGVVPAVPKPSPAAFSEVPQAGSTQIKAKGDSGKEYQVFVNGEDQGKATAEADGGFTKTVPELDIGSKVTIKPISDGHAVDGQAVSEVAVGYQDPTKGGMFGVLVGGAVFSQQNQNYSQSSPFFGFNTGYGSRVFGAKRFIGTMRDSTARKVQLILTSDEDILIDSDGKAWKRDITENTKLVYKDRDIGGKILEILPGDNQAGNFRNYGTAQTKLNKGNFFSSARVNFRFQGIFESDGRTATGKEDATTSGTAAAVPKQFQFIASQQTFTAQAEAWLDFRPMRQFSFGPYVSFGASALIDKSNADASTKFVNDTGKSSTITKLDTDLKKFYEIGAMVNLRFPDQKFFLQSIFAYGNYEQYKDLDANPFKTLAITDPAYNTPFRVDDTRRRVVAKLRVFPEGLNTTFGRQMAITPMFGVDLNAGTGPDHLRFFTGIVVRLKGIDVADPPK